jgi:hypothetical protein
MYHPQRETMFNNKLYRPLKKTDFKVSSPAGDDTGLESIQ